MKRFVRRKKTLAFKGPGCAYTHTVYSGVPFGVRYFRTVIAAGCVFSRAAGY